MTHLHDGRPHGRAIATAALIALLATSAVAGGCGSGDDSDNGANASQAGQNDQAPRPSGDKAQIAWALSGIQEDFDNTDGAAYCAKLTPAGKAKVVRFAKAYGHGSNCVEAIDSLSRLTVESGVKQKPTKLLDVKVYGDRAAATVSNGGRKPEGMLFVNQDGQWKIPNPGFDDPTKAVKPIKPTKLQQQLQARLGQGTER